MVDPFNFCARFGFGTAAFAVVAFEEAAFDAVVVGSLFFAAAGDFLTAVSFEADFGVVLRAVFWGARNGLPCLPAVVDFFLFGFLIFDPRLGFVAVLLLAGVFLLFAASFFTDLAADFPLLLNLPLASLAPAADFEGAFFFVSALPGIGLLAGCLVVLVGRFLGLKGIRPVNLGGRKNSGQNRKMCQTDYSLV